MFGPSKFAAQLEGVKGFTRISLRQVRHSNRRLWPYPDKPSALAYLDAHGVPIVIKADGLAAGKGVTVAMDITEARAALDDIFSGRFGGAECVIEEFLEG